MAWEQLQIIIQNAVRFETRHREAFAMFNLKLTQFVLLGSL